MLRPLTGRVAGALAALLLLTLQTPISASASTTAADRELPVYRPPVPAPVIDPFRLPPNPFAAGNRGVDYGTSPGESVHSSSAGVVTFAGPVGGSLHVVVLHSDGVRTSYSFLGSTAVRRGQEVGQGDVIGTTGMEPLHFGARRGDDYVDPLGLFSVGASRVRVRLLPDDGRGLPPEADERSALSRLLRVARAIANPSAAAAWAGHKAAEAFARLAPQAAEGLADAVLRYTRTGDLIALADELRRHLPDPSLAEVVAAILRTLATVETPLSVALNLTAWQLTKGPCTPRSKTSPTRNDRSSSPRQDGSRPSTQRPPSPSSRPSTQRPASPSSRPSTLRPASLSSRPPADQSPQRQGTPSTPSNTTASATKRAAPDGVSGPAVLAVPDRRLAVLVGGLGSSSGHAAILDLDTEALGYSAEDTVQFSYRGGTTDDNSYSAADTQIAFDQTGRQLGQLLERLAHENPGVPIDVFAHSQGGLVARSALSKTPSPSMIAAVRHLVTFGTPHDGADLAAMVDAALDTRPGRLVGAIGARTRPLGLDPTQRSLDALAPGSDELRALAKAELPETTRVTSVAARSDLVVPGHRSWLPGATNVIVDGEGFNAHGELPGSQEALREAALAVNDLPPTCESFIDAVLDTATVTAIQLAEGSAVAALRPHSLVAQHSKAYR